MDFSVVDIIVIAVILMSALLAYSRGFTREIMAIVGWVGAAIVGLLFSGVAKPLVVQIPFVGKYIGDSCELSMIAAFVGVFTIALILFSLFTPLLSSFVQRSALNGVDQGLGFFYGALRGMLLVSVGFFLYSTVLGDQTIDMIENSRSAGIFSGIISSEDDTQTALTWVTNHYDSLLGHCVKPTEGV